MGGYSVYTLNPSFRRHALCASISFLHASSPLSVMHSSRALFVSGHAQQIFFFGFSSLAAVDWAAFSCPLGDPAIIIDGDSSGVKIDPQVLTREVLTYLG